MDKNFLLIIRGPSGSGKTTLTKAVQKHNAPKVAHLRADHFQWKVCPQDEDKHVDNNPVVYKNLVDLANNYLSAKYSVVVEGLLSKIDEFGVQGRIDKLLWRYDPMFLRVFLDVDYDIALERNIKGKDIDIPEEWAKNWIEEGRNSITDQDVVVDTNKIGHEEVFEKVIAMLQE